MLAIETDALSKRYGDADALWQLDLAVEPGETLGYLGPNGAGKTTTIRLLLGLIRASAGRAHIFGIDCQRDPVRAHTRISYVPGEATLWPSLTGRETLSLLGHVSGRVDLSYQDTLIERFAFDPDKKVRAYSKGNRQKLVLIAALMTRADLLLMDEPTAGLDPLMEQAFRLSVREAKERGQTIFLSSHVLSEVEALCDRVAILRAGRLVDIGTLGQLRHLSSVSVEAHLQRAPDDLSGVPGVTIPSITPRVGGEAGVVLTCQVRGSMAPLLLALDRCGVDLLLSREPSLEELFLAHYGGASSLRSESSAV